MQKKILSGRRRTKRFWYMRELYGLSFFSFGEGDDVSFSVRVGEAANGTLIVDTVPKMEEHLDCEH